MQTTKTEIICKFWYFSKTLSFSGYAKIKIQGNSTTIWPKKNQSVKLFKDAECTEKLKVDFKGWGRQNKYVIKAYWNDITHTRDIVSVRLESDCARTRSDYAEMPEEICTSPNMGAVDGFPVLVWASGIYQGRYMWNIPKDKWMNNMDDELENHCMLVSEGYTDSSLFRGAAQIDGSDWTDEIHDTVPDSIKTRWNEVITFVSTATDAEFRANLGNYINVNSLIDRHLVGLYSCDYDGYGKNQRYDTYDGQLWYAVPYDKDGTWGVFWDGSKILPANYGREEYEDMTTGVKGNLLFIRLEQVFWPEMQARWPVLKTGPLSIPNTINRFRELYDITPPHIIAEDYAKTTAGGAFTAMPQVNNLTAQQFQTFAVDRHAWMDEYVAALTPEEAVPCTGITLSATELAFTEVGTQTLTATVEPENTTDAVVWSSDDTSIATVSSGEVRSNANGSCVITATCGEQSASCNVYVSGIESGTESGDVPADYVYALSEARTFSGASQNYIDTNTKLFDESKDFAIVIEFEGASDTVSGSAVFHCANEATPWPGVGIDVKSAHGYRVYANGGHLNVSLGDTRKQKYVIQKDSTANVLTIYKTFENTILQKNESLINATFDLDIMLGIKQDTTGVPTNGTAWKGTIHDFRVYFRKLTDTEIINELGDERTDLISSNNIAWTPTANYGFNNGEQIDGDGYVTTDFIPVTARYTYTLKNVDGGSFTYLEMHWYDSNHAYLTNNAADTDNKSIQTTSDAPDEAAYAKLKIFPNNNAENTPDKVIFY